MEELLLHAHGFVSRLASDCQNFVDSASNPSRTSAGGVFRVESTGGRRTRAGEAGSDVAPPDQNCQTRATESSPSKSSRAIGLSPISEL